MALKKSRVRVSLAPFFLSPFLLSFCVLPFALQAQTSSAVPDLVVYTMAQSDGTLKFSMAYRDLVSGVKAQQEGEALAKNLSLALVGKPSVRVDKGGDGTKATSVELQGRGRLPARDGMPDLLPFLATFRTHKQMELIVPAEVNYDTDRRDQIAQNEAYHVQWDRSQNGAYQYHIAFRDGEATLTPPIFRAVERPETSSSDTIQASDTSLSNPSQKFILFALATLAGISLLCGVLLFIRRGRVTAH